MKATGERRTLGGGAGTEDAVLDLFHRFPYDYVKRLVTPSTRVLDYGSGEGYGAGILAGSVAEYVGVDVSEAAVRHATARYPLPNVRFQLSDGKTIPASPESFDLVISFHVLEHVHDADGYVAELGRACRPGGRLVIVTPNRAFRLSGSERPWNRFHVREYDREELAELLGRHFSDLTVLGMTGTDALVAVERKRVERARRIARLDVLGLRYRLPEPLLVRVRRTIARVAGGRAAAGPKQAFSLDDVRCVSDGVEDAVHLLAVVEKT